MALEESAEVRPFRIDIPQSVLDDLKARLEGTRWPSQVADAGWSRGAELGYVRELAEYWAREYDWRKHEAELNSYPQFTTVADGQSIHFLHVRSRHEGATPLLLAHGWPGSVVEFLDVIEPLTNPANPEDAFHLVIPSHPNFGFSGPAADGGWDSFRIAGAYAEIMRRLGYDRYGAQGGDFGAFIAPDLGRVAPDRVIGVHVNAATAGFIPFGDLDEQTLASLTDGEKARLERMNLFLSDGNGYFQIQATRPHTIGFALADSPAGQLAWIAEKFKDWTYGDGLPEEAISRDRILTNVMLYWLTNTGASSAQMYYDSMHSQNWPSPSQTPTAVANLGEDIAIRQFAERLNNITRWTEFDKAGHFAALEEPELFVTDVQAFFASLR